MGLHLNPFSGIGASPRFGGRIPQTSGVVKDTLSRNLKSLMAANPGLNTLPKITQAGGPPNGVLDRIRRAEGACRIDSLAQLARVFGLEAWQILVPDLDPRKLPQLEMSAETAQELRQHLDAIARIIPTDDA
jgi:hypothetical protein